MTICQLLIYTFAVVIPLKVYIPIKFFNYSAALLIQNERIIHDQTLIERVSTSLLKQNQFEKAGDFFESLERYERALEAYCKGHSYRKAVDLSRKYFRSRVVSLEEEWYLFLQTYSSCLGVIG